MILLAKRIRTHCRDTAGMSNRTEGVETQEIIAGFRINADISKYIRDLFAVLWTAWPYIVDVDNLKAYDAAIARHYDFDCVFTCRQAVIAAYTAHYPDHNTLPYADGNIYYRWLEDISQYRNFLLAMNQTLFKTFQHILLYGKGQRGRCFLYFAKSVGINVGGYIVSDGHTTEKSSDLLPVYEYTKIPFDLETVLIILTCKSTSWVEQVLQQSPYHWMKLPEEFWLRAIYTDLTEDLQ